MSAFDPNQTSIRCLRAVSPHGDVGSPRKSMRLLVGLHGESHINLMSNALQRVIRLRSKPLRRLRAQPFFEKLGVPKRSRGRFHGRGSRASMYARKPIQTYGPLSLQQEVESLMNEWLKLQILESEAGMEVTSYLPAELDRA